MRGLTAILVLGMLSGCAADYKAANTRFFPERDGRFTYTERSHSTLTPLNDPKAEAERVALMEEYLRDNRMCPRGYRVTERLPVFVQETLIGIKLYDVIYRGECV